jgi:hypothetical protein
MARDVDMLRPYRHAVATCPPVTAPADDGCRGRVTGQDQDMSASGPDPRSEQRADDILPEERAAGSADPESQAAAVLADSDVRATERDGDQAEGSDRFEHRSSDETVEP